MELNFVITTVAFFIMFCTFNMLSASQKIINRFIKTIYAIYCAYIVSLFLNIIFIIWR